jgi:hypothetical protein
MPGLSTYTLIHVAISLVDIVTGLVVVAGLLRSQRLAGWTLVFLATALATDITGFFFPYHGFTPAIGLGIISTVVLVPTIAAYYAFGLAGGWRWVYAIGAVATLYFNIFVLIVQSFQKVPALKMLAPKGSEPPFAITQGIALVVFVILGSAAVRSFRPSAQLAPA